MKKNLTVEEKYNELWENGVLLKIIMNVMSKYRLSIEDKEDLIQDICIYGKQHLHNYTPIEGKSFNVWFLSVSTNYLNSYFRKMYTKNKSTGEVTKRISTVSMTNKDGELIDRIDETQNLEQIVIEEENNKFFYNILSKLSDKDRIIIDYVISGDSYKDIEKKTGINAGTLRKRVHDLKIKLAKMYVLHETKNNMHLDENNKYKINKNVKTDGLIYKKPLSVSILELDTIKEEDSVKVQQLITVRNCEVNAEKYILGKLGLNISIRKLTEEFVNNKLWSESETENIGKLLERHGANVSRFEKCSVDEIINKINDDNKILVSVNADKLYEQPVLRKYKNQAINTFCLRGANYSVIVEKYDSENNNFLIYNPIFNDTFQINKDDFLSCWVGNMVIINK